jgi:hypothetical protein
MYKGIIVVLAIVLIGVYIFSCSGEHSTKEESATTDSSAVVKDSIEVIDVIRP